IGSRRAIAHPLARANMHRLARSNGQARSALAFHEKFAPEHISVFVKLRTLAWFHPARRTAHVGNADITVAAVYTTENFVDKFRFVTRSFNASRLLDKTRRHAVSFITQY